MIKISIDDILKRKCPDLPLAVLECKVENSAFSQPLWDEIKQVETEYRHQYTHDDIKSMATIQATRKAYKLCGKDPNRYRPAAEALARRILKGNELYQINTLVDLVNLISLKSGYSIGGFDADAIEGNIHVGIGLKGELYNGIGRGQLNVEGLPILRDAKGGIGTPTSDEERTKLHDSTTHFFMNINGYAGLDGLKETQEWAITHLQKYVNATEIETAIVG